MRKIWAVVLFFCAAVSAAVQAQKPVAIEEARGKDDALIRSQQRAEFAYRQLQEAQYKRGLAEQDYLNTRDAYRAARQRADDLKREVDALKKALDVARNRESAARKVYEKELNAVDRLPRNSRP